MFDRAAVLIILAAFTISFVLCGVITYRIRRSKNKKSDENRD